jgi:chromosome segregation ATPase
MGLSVGGAIAIARAIDNRNKRDAWERDMHDNIYRWESSIEKLEAICTNTEANIRKNRNAIDKAEHFLSNLTSGKSREWYERACTNRDKYEDLNAKVVAYEDKVNSATERINRITQWIQNDETKLRDIRNKINDINHKINDVEHKLRN